MPRMQPMPRMSTHIDSPRQDIQGAPVAVIEHGRRYTDADVTVPLAQAAINWLKGMTTPPSANGFLLDMHNKAMNGERFNTPQIRGVLNWMARDADLAPSRQATPPPTPIRRPVRIDLTPGTYTVLSDDGEHITIELAPADPSRFSDLPAGSMIASYLNGPDNEADYMGFAFVKPSGVFMWKRFAANTRLKSALEFLACATDDQLADAGYQYALKSGRCWKCRRKLTVPTSLFRGMGPVCAAKIDAT